VRVDGLRLEDETWGRDVLRLTLTHCIVEYSPVQAAYSHVPLSPKSINGKGNDNTKLQVSEALVVCVCYVEVICAVFPGSLIVFSIA